MILFVNAVDGNFEKCLFSVEFVFSIVLREGDGYVHAVSRVMADELFFEVINVTVGTDDKVSTVAFCVSALKFHAVNGTDIVNIDGIAVLNGEGKEAEAEVEADEVDAADEALSDEIRLESITLAIIRTTITTIISIGPA